MRSKPAVPPASPPDARDPQFESERDATVVLIRQNRLAKLAEQRAHLDLKVTLLIEQKAAKLIDLLEELRRDLPNVRNRHDSEAAALQPLQQSMNPDQVLAALDERGEPDERLKPAGEAKINQL